MNIREMMLRGAALKPHEDVPYNEQIMWAVRAAREGKATAHQAQVLFEWLLLVVSRYQSTSFQPDSARASDFMEGRRFVGAQMQKMLAPELTPPPKTDGEPPEKKGKK